MLYYMALSHKDWELYGKPIVAIFNKGIFQFKEPILVQFNE